MRTIAYNVYGATGFPAPPDAADGSNAAAIAGELEGLDPTIVSFAEAPPKETVESIAVELGMDAAFFPSRGDWPGAICSAYPIASASPLQDELGALPEDLLTRHGGRAVLETPLGEVVVYSLHLYPGGAHDRRIREIARVRQPIAADLTADRSVIVQGDLNHPPTGPEYLEWRLLGLTDAYAAAGTGPGATIKAHDPNRRIDYVLTDATLADRLTDARVIRSPPFGPGEPADELPGRFLSDHLPVAATFDV